MDVKDIIKNSITIKQVADYYGLPNLGPCPTGHKSKGGQCFGINYRHGFFHCINCNVSGDVIDLVELMEKVTFTEALKWLAEKYRPDLLPIIDKSSEPSPEELERIERGSLYDLVYQYGKDLLYTPPGRDALDYLVNVRGYPVENLKKTDWIYFPPKQEIIDHLLNLYPEADRALKDRIQNISLKGRFGYDFSRLAFPYRDREGIITGFVIRSIDPKAKREERWDNTTGERVSADLFNLNNCKNKPNLIIVEGYPDALYLTTLGLDVVAVGQGAFSRGYIEGLQAFKVLNVTIAFNNDPETKTGLKNTEGAIDILRDTGINIYILDPLLLAPHKDPDEYVQREGIDAFKSLLRKAESGATWKLKRIIGRHDLTMAMGERDALDESIDYINTISDPLDDKNCRRVLSESFPELSKSTLDEHVDDYREKKAREREIKSYLDLSREIERGALAGDIDKIREILPERILTLRTVSGSTRSIEDQSIEAYLDRLRTTPEGLETGYGELDEYVRIRQGAITILAGRPSHGKTSLMLNLMANMIEKYPDKSFLFFSYEMTSDQVRTNLITLLSEDTLGKSPYRHNYFLIEKYLKGQYKNHRGEIESRGKIETAKKILRLYTRENRLWVTGEPYHIEELTNTITLLSKVHPIGAVFIDYIQKVKIKGSFQNRQVEIQKVSESLLETAKSLNIPIILGTQLDRETAKSEGKAKTNRIEPTLDHLRKSGDIEQDAALVISLYNDAVDKAQEEGEENPENMTIELNILKNRTGTVNKSVTLTFNGPTLKMSIKPKDDLS